MPIGIVDRLPSHGVSARARVDPVAWCVRVALLLLVSPALLLVLIVGGLFLLAQLVSRGWRTLSGTFGGVRPRYPSHPPEPSVATGATAMCPAVAASGAYRDRPA